MPMAANGSITMNARAIRADGGQLSSDVSTVCTSITAKWCRLVISAPDFYEAIEVRAELSK